MSGICPLTAHSVDPDTGLVSRQRWRCTSTTGRGWSTLATGLVERLAAPGRRPVRATRRRRADGRGTRLADPPHRRRPRRRRQHRHAVSRAASSPLPSDSTMTTTRGASSGSPGRCSTSSPQGVVDVPGWGRRPDRSTPAPSQRFAVARRIADLFDRYATTRPEILRQWQRGVRGDGTVRLTSAGGSSERRRRTHGRRLAAVDALAVRAVAACPRADRQPEPGRAAPGPHRASCGVASWPPASPARVELFGVSTLSRDQLDVLAALAEARDVHVSLLHPSAVAWLRTPPVDPSPIPPCATGAASSTARVDSHPLLRSWGRQSSETAALVRGLPAPAIVEDDRRRRSSPVRPATLLDHVRADLRADRPPTPFVRPAPTRASRCTPVTARSANWRCSATPSATCSSATRRCVPTTSSSSVPTSTRFEPFAAAVFGRGTLPVPVTVSDLSLGTENPVAGGACRRSSTRSPGAARRATCSPSPPSTRCAAGSAITADDLDRFACLDAAPRHEVGPRQRAPRRVARRRHRPRHVGAVTALVARRGGDAGARAARSRSAASCRSTTSAATTSPGSDASPSWSPACAGSAGCRPGAGRSASGATSSSTSSTSSAPRRRPRPGRPRRCSKRSTTSAGRRLVGESASSVPLAFDDVLAVVDGVVAHRRGRVQLRTGRVTITGSAPVRNVPAKVVCVLGFDESSLRRAGIDGDDLLAVRPCVGERDRHAERRNLLLDALFAAEQALIVTCDGSDVTTNRRIRFAVQLSELLDVVDATLEPSAAPAGDERLAGAHPAPAARLRRTQLRPRRRVGDVRDLQLRRRDVSRRRDAPPPVRRRRGGNVATLRPRGSRAARGHPAPARRRLRAAGADAAPRRARRRLPGEVARVDHEIPLSVSKLEAASVGRRLLERYWRQPAVVGAGAGDDDWDAAARDAIDEWAHAERLAGAAPPGRLIDDTLDGSRRRHRRHHRGGASVAGSTALAVLGASDAVDVDVELDGQRRAHQSHATGVPDRLRLVDSVGRHRRRRDLPARLSPAEAGTPRRRRHRPRCRRAGHRRPALAGLTVTRAAQGNGGAECHLFEVIAADPQAAARTLLETAAELRVAALSGAVPVFETTTRTLYDEGLHRRGRARRHGLPQRRPRRRQQPLRVGRHQRRRADRAVAVARRTWRRSDLGGDPRLGVGRTRSATR